jgi:hypothetical protein
MYNERFIAGVASGDEGLSRGDNFIALVHHAPAIVDYQAYSDGHVASAELPDLLDLAIILDYEILFFKITDEPRFAFSDGNVQSNPSNVHRDRRFVLRRAQPLRRQG